MPNHKLGRNILLAGAFLSLFAVLRPRENRDLTGQILFGIQGVLFLLGAYLQQREIRRAKDREDVKKTL